MRHSELGCIAHVYSNGRATPKTCNENKSSRSSDRPGADEQRSRAGVAHSLGTLQERGDAAVRRPAAQDPILTGAIDLHAHYGPDSYPRQWDAFEIAALAQAAGLRGIVLKNHCRETAGIAYLVRKYGAQGIEVFGARHARYAGGRAEPTGRSLHGGRHGRLGPHRLDAHSRLRARGHVQQRTAALRPRFSRRRAAARGSRSHRLGSRARAHVGDGARHSRRDAHDPRGSAQARNYALDRDASAARPAVHVHVDAAAARRRRVGRHHRDHCRLALA